VDHRSENPPFTLREPQSERCGTEVVEFFRSALVQADFLQQGLPVCYPVLTEQFVIPGKLA
jgi:hypothetical protein